MGTHVATRGLAMDMMCAAGVVATCAPCAGWPAGVTKSASSPVAAATSARVGYNAYGLRKATGVSEEPHSHGKQDASHALGLVQQRGRLLLLPQVAQLLEGTPVREVQLVRLSSGSA